MQADTHNAHRKPYLDYIRIATWDYTQYTNVLARLMKNWPFKWKQGRWLQYKGWRKEELFIGHGEQNGKHHCIIQTSGSLSDRVVNTLLALDGWYCTRLDIQITLICPENFKLAWVRDQCRTNNTTLIESKNNDTLYLGSRTSDIFARLYEKIAIEKLLRLEFELKGLRARAAWQSLMLGEYAQAIFLYYLRSSKLPDDIKAMYEDYEVESTKHAMRLIKENDTEKVLKWITSLSDSIELNLANHEIGESVKVLVRSWAALADKLDQN